MPSSSKAQQKFMGIVHGIQKGTIDPSSVSGAAKKAAKSMKKKSAKDYASTKHKGLPKKVKEEGFGGDLKGEDKKKFERARKANGEQLGYKLSGTSDVKEDRDYKEEYKKYGSSTKAKKYRAELNQYNRKKGTYGNGDGKDASHKGGKIVGFESQSKNRGRAEKSRLKKESSSAYGKSIEKMANDRKLKSISKKDRGLLLKIAKLMKKANEAKTVSIGASSSYAITLSPFFADNSSSSLFSISLIRTYSPLGKTSPKPITSSDISLSNSISFSFKYLINSFSNISGSSTDSLNVSFSKNNAAAYVPTLVLSPGTFANIFLILKTNL